MSEAFNAGASVKELKDRYQVTQGTIFEYLTKYYLTGHPLRHAEDLHALVGVTPE